MPSEDPMTAHSANDVQIRPFLPGDLGTLVHMNNAAVPAVNALSAEDLLDQINMALVCLVAMMEDTPAGFLLCMADGVSYDSKNYRWLSGRFDNFAYTDRICVDEAQRGKDIGGQLYRALFDHVSGSGRCFVCEVNERPPNPGSLKFHKRLGFEEVGREDHGEKAVIFLKRPAEAGS